MALHAPSPEKISKYSNAKFLAALNDPADPHGTLPRDMRLKRYKQLILPFYYYDPEGQVIQGRRSPYYHELIGLLDNLGYTLVDFFDIIGSPLCWAKPAYEALSKRLDDIVDSADQSRIQQISNVAYSLLPIAWKLDVFAAKTTERITRTYNNLLCDQPEVVSTCPEDVKQIIAKSSLGFRIKTEDLIRVINGVDLPYTWVLDLPKDRSYLCRHAETEEIMQNYILLPRSSRAVVEGMITG